MSQEPSKSCPASSSAALLCRHRPRSCGGGQRPPRRSARRARRGAGRSSRCAGPPAECAQPALVLAGPDDHDHLAFGHATEQPLDERCSEKARRPGHGDSPAGELVGITGVFLAPGHRRAGASAAETGWGGGPTPIGPDVVALPFEFGSDQRFGVSARAGAGFFGAGRRGAFGGV